MGKWVLHSEDDLMATWLKASISSKCSYCGSEMKNYYNDEWRCTNRRCSNDDCHGMKGHRADFMFKLLGYKGIGPATCISVLGRMPGQNHVVMLKDYNKPKMNLATYLRIHCFEGVDSIWETICTKNSFYTLDELFEQYSGKHKEILDANKELLYNNLQYVTLTKPENLLVEKPTKYITIMITGTPIGFENKTHFINAINAAMGGKIVVLHQKSKRQTEVDFLIREPGSTTKGKVEAAIKGGIPIKTSAQFTQYLVEELLKMNSEN